MRVAVEELPGVEAVDVSLNEGVARVRLAPDNRVSPEEVRAVIRSNGFSPKAAEVRVAGRVVDVAGRPALRVPGPDRVYLLEDAAGAPEGMDAAGTEVIVEGRLPETEAETPARTLVVRRIRPGR